MADPFTPKFVDLVRNYTTTTGTGDFKLGTAANGYASLTVALQVGDQFYYSAIGVDKPAEREVGRGTLLANGIVKREPISGAKTNFTSGTKAIALIAAAEWFSAVQSSAGQSPRVAATRAELAGIAQRQWPALLSEAGREGLFVWDASNLTAAVTADAAQGIYVAPSSDPTGSTGAWVRKSDGGLRPEWFGAKGDGSTDDKVALQAWLDAGGELSLPAKIYRSSARLIVRKLVRVTGRGSNWTASKGSVIKFDAGIDGIDIQPETPGTTFPPASASQDGAFGSTFRDFALLGQGAGTAVGFYCRTYVHASNVNVWNFSGKGFDLSASSDFSDGNSEYGNMSNSALYDCGAYGCGSHGLNIRGRDANTITVENFSAISNGGWGILNESVIGNLFIKPNIANNTLGAIKIPGLTGNIIISGFIEGDGRDNCEINTNCIVLGGDLNSVNNAPLTGYGGQPNLNKGAKFIWSYAPEALGSEYGLAYNWDGMSLQGRGSAKDVAFYNKDGALAAYVPTGTTNLKVANTLLASNVQATIAPESTVFGSRFQSGGTNSYWPGVADGYMAMFASGTTGCTLGGYGTTYDTALTNRTGTVAAGVVANTTNFAVAGNASAGGTISGSNLTTSGLPTAVATGTIIGRSAAGTGAASALATLPTAAMPALTGDVTTAGGALATTIASNAVTYAKIQQAVAARLVGNPTGAVANVQEISLAGGLSFSGSTLTLGPITPTSVAATGAITSSSGGVGYSTGAGGTVVQTTNKSTGVTLNKLCGQITTSSVALAASTGVSFTVTNNQVAATDTIDLVLTSGNAAAGTYNYQVDKVAAGSFVIWFKNISGGSLSEALLFNFSVKKAVNA